MYVGVENRNPFCDLNLRQSVLSSKNPDDLVGISVGKDCLREFSKTDLKLNHEIEPKNGFFTNTVALLRKDKEYFPENLADFLIRHNVFLSAVTVKDVENLPNNIYFRFCTIKAVISNLESKGFQVN